VQEERNDCIDLLSRLANHSEGLIIPHGGGRSCSLVSLLVLRQAALVIDIIAVDASRVLEATMSRSRALLL